LGEFFHSTARELSLGQKMRADLGLALLPEPEILFLDEPTIGLDVLAKRNILNCIKDLNRERRVTVMVTSHDMSELEQLAGRIVMIHRGDIAFDGDFGTLRREFADRRRLLLETGGEFAPVLDGAQLIESQGGRHEYVFDAGQVKIAALLAQASAQADVHDVETHRAPIDEVIADVYERWLRDGHVPAVSEGGTTGPSMPAAAGSEPAAAAALGAAADGRRSDANRDAPDA
jgi:ABC-2 type transport system ATP-binding protein